MIDQESENPLSGVTIIISPCDCGGITNLNGIFTKKLKQDNYSLNIDYLGYGSKNVMVDLNGNKTLTISMEVEEEELSEVVLLAQKRNKNIESTQMGVLELNIRELKKAPSALGEFDVLRSISLLAGVNNSGDVSNGVSIRGGSLDQNLLFYDAAPVFNPTHLFGLLSVFTPDVIAGVDIYRANIPSKYGGRIASVLDIKVKNPFVDKFKLEGGIGLMSSKLTVTTPLIKDKLLIIAGGRAGLSDIFFPLLVPRLKNTKAKFFDSTVKLLYLLNSSNQFTYTHFYSKDFYQLDLVSSVENIVAQANQYDYKTQNHTLRWLHTFKNETNLTGYLIHSDYTPQNLFPEFDSDNVIGFKSRIQYTRAQFEFTNNKKEDLGYYLGLETKRYQISPGSLDPGNGNSINPVELSKETGYESSIYANLDWRPTPKLSVSGGLRLTQFMLLGPYDEAQYDENGLFDGITSFEEQETVINYFNPEPRLGINYKIADNTSVKMSYARIFQYIQNIYNTNSPLPTSRWKISDRYISPQKNNTYGLGLYQNIPEKYLIY